jgi:hypothetical protein
LGDTHDEPSFHRSEEDDEASSQPADPETPVHQEAENHSDDSSEEDQAPVRSRFFTNMVLSRKKRKNQTAESDAEDASDEKSETEQPQPKKGKKIQNPDEKKIRYPDERKPVYSSKEVTMLELFQPYRCNDDLLKVWNALKSTRTLSLQGFSKLLSRSVGWSQEYKKRHWREYDTKSERELALDEFDSTLATLDMTHDLLKFKRATTLEEKVMTQVLRDEHDFSDKVMIDLLNLAFPNTPARSLIGNLMSNWKRQTDDQRFQDRISEKDQLYQDARDQIDAILQTNPFSHLKDTRKHKQYVDASRKCKHCTVQMRKCERTQNGDGPCQLCISKKQTCIFATEDSKVKICFYGENESLPEIFSTPQDSVECCHNCSNRSKSGIGKNFVGDGAFPCNNCIEQATDLRENTANRVKGVSCARTLPNGSVEICRLLKAKQPSFAERREIYGDKYSQRKIGNLDDAKEAALDYSSWDDETALQSTRSPTKLGDQGGNRKKSKSVAQSTKSKRPLQDLDHAPRYTRDEYDDDDEDATIHAKDFATLAFVNPLILQTLKSIQQLPPSCSAVLLDTDPEPRTRAEAMRSPEATEWDSAMKEEHKSLVDNDTWDVVPRPRNRKVLKSRWVFKRKRDAQNKVKRYKARGVGKGFTQVHGLDFDETYASVVKSPSYRLFFALQAKLGMKCRQIDIQTAFLNGDLEHEVYMEPLDGFPVGPGNVLRLKRSIYGLKQSPRQWYHKLREYLESIGWRVSDFDQSVYIGPDFTFMTVYVDDIRIYAMRDEQIEAIVQQMAERFQIKDLGEGDFYLGMHVHKNDKEEIHVHQTAYIKERLRKYGFEDLRPADTPMDSNNKPRKYEGEPMSTQFQRHYQSVMGSLNYASIVSRPDISTAVGILCRFNHNPNEEHLAAAKRVWAYLKGHPSDGLTYKRHVKGEELNDLYIMSDADWAGCPDTRKSTSGYVVMFAGAPVSWISKKQECNALSSCEAEYIAGSIAAQEAMWFKNMINDLHIPGLKIDQIPFYVDNQSAIAVAKNPEHHNRMKHIENRMHFLRDCVQNGNISIRWVPSKDNLADFLTKPLPKDQHHRLRSMAGILPATCDVVTQHEHDHHEHDDEDVNSSAFSDTTTSEDSESEDSESEEDSDSSST